MEKALGRLIPPDFDHVAKYPLRELSVKPAGKPGVFGINWYTDFDRPVLKDDRYWIGLNPKVLGSNRGGHAICTKPAERPDPLEWWEFYNQNPYPRCVGYSESRCMSLYNRVKYDANWLYAEAQKIDGWAMPHDGTSVRAGFQVLMNQGHKRINVSGPAPVDGISAYRWAGSVDEIIDTLAMPLAVQLGAIPLLQTWGKGYPHVVWILGETADRLLREGGEFGIPTDR